ncbi:MAG: hypothetical protein AAB343_02375 [Patescibacteria group bacterium]
MSKTLIQMLAEYDSRQYDKKACTERDFPETVTTDQTQAHAIEQVIHELLGGDRVYRREGIVNDPKAREILIRCQLGISRLLFGKEIGIFVP